MTKVIVDVREPHEFNLGHFKDSINVPLSRFSDKEFVLAKFSVDDQIIVYCRSGGRASLAEQLLKSYGYKNVVNLINQEYLEHNINNI